MTVLSGIRGGLIAVLAFLSLQALAGTASLWAALGDLIALAVVDTPFDHLRRVFSIEFLAIDACITLAWTAISIYVLTQFLRRRRGFPRIFLIGLLQINALVLAHEAAFVLLVKPDAGFYSGTGLLLALGIYQYLLYSKRAQNVFVNH